MISELDDEGLSPGDAIAMATAAHGPDNDTHAGGDRLLTIGEPAANGGGADLMALFAPSTADNFRSRWVALQEGFVDNPKEAVRQGDELVAELCEELMDAFATARAKLEDHLDAHGTLSTEELRLVLRRYRSFFERLLAL
jgi:hypothetical protein